MEDEYQKELRYYTLGMVQQSNSEAYDFISALVYDEKIPLQHLKLQLEDFPDFFYRNIWSALILEALNIQDYRVHRRLMDLCLIKVAQDLEVSRDPVLCYQVMKKFRTFGG